MLLHKPKSILETNKTSFVSYSLMQIFWSNFNLLPPDVYLVFSYLIATVHKVVDTLVVKMFGPGGLFMK